MSRPLACLPLLLSLSLLLSALAPCQAKPHPSASIPALLNEADGYRFAFQYDPPRIPYIIIQVSINGKPPLPFMLDTGTDVPVTIDKEAAQGLGLPMTAFNGRGNGGRVSFARATTVRSVHFLGLTGGRNFGFTGAGAVVVDLALLKERLPWIKLAGVVGVTSLDKFTVRLDFSHKILTLYLKPHPPISITGATAVPLIELKNEHRHFVLVSPSQGVSTYLLLDTGSVETSLPLPIANKIRSTPRIGLATGLLGTYYISQALLLPKMKVGDAVIYEFEVGSSPTLAYRTLGIDLLSCFRVTLDFPHHQMFLERAADRPYRLHGWVGISLKPDGNDFRVRSVEPGSPAAVAGLQVDDKVLSIDDQPLQGLSVEAAKTLRDDPAGTRTTFLIQRGESKPFPLSFVAASLFAAPPDIKTGLVAEKPDKQPVSVIQVEEGFPAQKAGLMAGDTITEIDGVPSESLSLDQTNDAFGKDKLTLTVRRAGEAKPRTIILVK